MTVKISVLESYILVEPGYGVNYWDILEGSIKLSKTRDFAEKNDIWVFKEGPLMLTIDDLFRLQDIIFEHYPVVSRERKTAIVVESGFMSGLVKTFMEISPDLPFKLRVFEDLALAENWIAKDY